ncbi:MAG: MATE family efflux transporter [Candidatus Paracaedibacteraceae bacterium]|nr:MATE family efflux transporter [Candidatus Paracaedibacteraceae bacterium]
MMSALNDTSMRSLIRISLPMMLAFMSTHVMLFVNRVMLSEYSLDAMNGVATAGMIAAVFQFGIASITSIAEVYVGQFNGLKQYEKLGKPVWQMIWFALSSQLVFIPIALCLSDMLIPESLHQHGLPFFRVIMYFGCLQALFTALSSFYVGQGKTILVTVAAVIGNIVNVALNYLFIFGSEQLGLDPMGAIGSAYATVIASIVQVFILFVLFVSPGNQKNFGTSKMSVDLSMVWGCLKVGTPAATGHMLEIGAWSVIAHILAGMGGDYITIQNLCSTFFLLFSFFTEGLQKGIVAISSNLIGSHQIDRIKQVLINGIKIHCGVMLFLIIPFFVVPQVLAQPFMIAPSSDLALYFSQAMQLLWFFFLFDGLVWVTSGVLVSAGDTKFIMVVNACTAWFFAVIPIKLVTLYWNVSPGRVWGVVVCYAGVNLLFFYRRYRSQKWLKLDLGSLKS